MDGDSPGQTLMKLALGNCVDHSVTLVIVASLTDSATLLREAEELFVTKVKHVVIQGGVQPFGDAGGTSALLVPDTAHNNMFDSDARCERSQQTHSAARLGSHPAF